MKLNEVIEPTSQFMTDHDDIAAWLIRRHIKTYQIHPNGVVDVDGQVNLIRRAQNSIPVQFGRVSDDFWCNNNNLTSLIGCPSWVDGEFECENNKITSLSGIHKLVKRIGGGFVCDNVTNVLGLMLIDGLYTVDIIGATGVNEIMNRHLRKKTRDIHACQEELIEAGFAAQAKL